MQVPGMIEIQRSGKENRWLVFVFVAVSVLLVVLSTAFAMNGTASEYLYIKDEVTAATRIIAVDPGHGGHDEGARGPEGSLEKEIALNLAQILAKTLKPDYQVLLTRNGDYQVALTRRASVANHQTADLFISIHMGGGSRYEMNAWSIFYYDAPDPSNGENHSEGQLRPVEIGTNNVRDLPLLWNHACYRHQKESRILAECIKTQLAMTLEIREPTVSKAALRVLQGLNMPAVIIETGYLTNPKTERHLNDPLFLRDIARRIKAGVDVYLTR
jgi:N-acetylmuramoyl-L-alanine amidase